MPSAVAPNEDLRQLEHFLPVGFAFLLRWLSWPQALAMAGAAVVYGALSSHIWPRTRRASEGAGAVSPGKVWYGLSVFLLILLFPGRQFIVAAAWANLSVGDSVSNVIGRRYGRRRLPWNRDKSWLGSLSGFASSTAAAWILILWTGLPASVPPRPEVALWFAAAVSLVCAVVETLPLPIDDNLAICIAGGAFLAWLSQASLPETFLAKTFVEGLLLSAGLGAVALIIGGVSRSGFVSGTVLGTAVYYAFGRAGLLLLAAFFVLGTLFTKLGYERKTRLGAAQADGARRSARHVWGKGAAAFLAALASLFMKDAGAARLGFVAAMAASFSDTTATELGLLAGGRPFLLATLRRVPAGTRGAVSAAGSAFGLLAAVLIAALGQAVGLVSPRGAVWAVIAATFATHLESWLAARRGDAGYGGAMMNAFHTVAALLLAALLGRLGL